MFVKICVLVVLVVWGEGAQSQSRRYQGSSRGGASATGQRGGGGGRGGSCPTPRLTNGFVTPLFKGRMMRFDCNKGFSRLGEHYAECKSGRWSIYTYPICIKAGCPAITTPDNGMITYSNAKASAMLFCDPNYESVGSSYAHCNGTHWDRPIGTCRETDNAAPTSCDFESESICGWTHDPDHDFDFERRHGYNNKTISMVTGPHADHTTGIPFQGHYMVINTNSEVYTKRARLISPLYRIAAQTLCFRFYYHMYGISLGTLRVYAKPHSVDLEDVLVQDTVVEVKNKYLVFETRGLQGNVWMEGTGGIENFNESFQIIIEAVSGQTRLSDIAFDDVSILTDDECHDEEDDPKAVPDSKDDDDGGVFSVDSCLNRCFEEKNATVELSANHTLSCICTDDCVIGVSCCPDFVDVCASSRASSLPDTENVMTTTPAVTSTRTTPVVTSTTIKLSSTTTVKIPTTLKTTLATRITPTTTSTVAKIVTSPAPTSTTSRSTSTTLSARAITTKTPQRVPISNQTEGTTQTMATDGPKDYNEVKGEDEHDMELDDLPLPTSTKDSDNIKNERFMMNTKDESGPSLAFIVKVSTIALAALLVSFFAFVIVYKQYKKSTNPLNYKERQENGSRKANEEFSEIRFLTSDETLDFNIASPDTTDL